MLKESLFHLTVLLLLFAGVLLVITGCVLLGMWTNTYNPAMVREAGWLKSHLPGAAVDSLIVSVLLSLFLLFGRLQRKPGNRLLSFLLPVILCLVLITGGYTVLHGPPGATVMRPESTFIPLVPDTIHSVESGLIYAEKVIPPDPIAPDGGLSDGARVENVIRYSNNTVYFDQTAAVSGVSGKDGEAARLIFGSTSQSAVVIEPVNPLYSPVFRAPDVIGGTIADVVRLNTYLLNHRSQAPEGFVFGVFAVVFMAMSCITFLGFTKWPLFNALFTLAVFRGIFLIVRFFDSDIGREIGMLIPSESLQSHLPSLVYLAFGLLFTLVYVMFGRRAQTRGVA